MEIALSFRLVLVTPQINKTSYSGSIREDAGKTLLKLASNILLKPGEKLPCNEINKIIQANLLAILPVIFLHRNEYLHDTIQIWLDFTHVTQLQEKHNLCKCTKTEIHVHVCTHLTGAAYIQCTNVIAG